MGKKSNRLIDETSPYLLQHAYNPVDWHAWNDQTLKKAQELGKPLLISIGYSACHWCHVMEGESFEDQEVADLMNTYFTCIKVDREERPDVDQLYMNAAQLITGRGGWPLNAFAFPDGTPFYAGTYYPKSNWMQLMQRIHDEFANNNQGLEDYSKKLVQGIRSTAQINYEAGFNASKEAVLKQIDLSVIQWSDRLDKEHGGMQGAPKFPMPNNLDFLLRYGYERENEALLDYVHLTLSKLAQGGIYDHVGGGFARYSVDALWKLPHFEKMLYDNGQLLKVYASAFKAKPNREFYSIIKGITAWVKEDLCDVSGEYYSAQDADSEGEEGKFYVWKKDEIEQLFGDDSNLVGDYYAINEKGYWEHDNYILLRGDDQLFQERHGLDEHELQTLVQGWNKTLKKARDKRIAPGIDDKILTSWNALYLSGLIEAYNATAEDDFLDQAREVADFIRYKQLNDDYSLWHSYKKGLSTINGFLEDYALVIQAFLELHSATGDLESVEIAKRMCDYTIDHFYLEDQGLFGFTSHDAKDLVVRNVEYFDNVIPSSNSTMYRNLLALGHLYQDRKYSIMASEMSVRLAPKFSSYGSGFSNWMIGALDEYGNQVEVVIVGDDALHVLRAFKGRYIPNALITASVDGKGLPVYEGRYKPGETLIYVCRNNACEAPVSDIDAALDIIKKAS